MTLRTWLLMPTQTNTRQRSDQQEHPHDQLAEEASPDPCRVLLVGTPGL